MSVDIKVTETYICDRCDARQDHPFKNKGHLKLKYDHHEERSVHEGREIDKDLCDECLDVVLRVINGEATIDR